MIPYLTVKDPRAAMALYEKALGATTVTVMDGPGGSVMHAEMKVGDSRFMLACEWPGMANAPQGRSPVNFMVYVDNADDAYTHAVASGMQSVAGPEDMFWGDRMARVNDGHGYEWTLAHQTEALTPDEVQRRAADYAASMEKEFATDS